MHEFKVPMRDVRFLLHDFLNIEQHYKQLPVEEECNQELTDAVLGECAKFCEQVIAPLNQSGDREGCKLEDGVVTTPTGFKEAYEQFTEAGWPALSHPTQYGGQGLPLSLGMVKSEFVGTANWSWGMYPGLSLGAMNTIFVHGTEEQKQEFLTPLVEGRWLGTMCLTEPQCGTDLGQVRTTAKPNGDGSYKVSGTKIFISAGDHNWTDNIIHIVLARLPGAPEGTRGISLFIIPKNKVNADGSVGEFNNVSCGSLEEKMGIKGSSTAVLNFDDAEGFLIGPENKGLECMFTFMNTARIGTAMQGVGAAELSYQGALAYAKDRRSMRALTGKKEPEKPADALIHHGDVRRMLLTQKAVAEGGRAMVYECGMMADKYYYAGDEEQRKYWDDQMGFITPILKGCLTELGLEASNLGMQVFGGHGFIKEWGMEQIARDTRIATLYEGTTGIQALDLLGRKTLILTRGKAVRDYTKQIMDFCRQHSPVSNSPYKKELRPFIWELTKLCGKWNYMTMRIMLQARKNRDIVGTASYDFLMFSGYVTLAFYWTRMAATALEKLEKGDGVETEEFYRAKIQTAEFYFDRILPRQAAHAEAALKPTESLMQMDNDHFAFL